MTESDQKLHLGCGSVTFPGWVNIDLDSPEADLLLDLTEPLPFADSSVSHMFNEHFIEHVTREQAVAFLKECYRVLTPQGVIRITTPNLRFLTHCYFLDSTNEWGELWQPNSRCQMMNEGMRSWGHQFVYDAEELARVITEAGFKSITFQTYRQSGDKNLSGLESRPFHNELIVEARKSSAVEVTIDFSAANDNESAWAEQSGVSAQVGEQAAVKVAAESAARAEYIEHLSSRIREVETAFADKDKAFQHHLERFAAQETELDLAEQSLAAQAAELDAANQSLAAQTAEIASANQSLAAQLQANDALQSRLDSVEAQLKVFQSSWYGRLKSFFNRTA